VVLLPELVGAQYKSGQKATNGGLGRQNSTTNYTNITKNVRKFIEHLKPRILLVSSNYLKNKIYNYQDKASHMTKGA
jgi:hypothetical protein